MDLVIVFVCGALGTALRAWIEQAWSTQTWPAATFAINLTGAFALGFLIGALSVRGPDQGARRRVRLGVGTGLLGGYTTFFMHVYFLLGLIVELHSFTLL